MTLPQTGIWERPLDGGLLEQPRPLHSTPVLSPPESGTAAKRSVILEQLYRERREYATKRRLGELTTYEEGYLAALDQEIDGLEAADGSLQGGPLWNKIDALAQEILKSHK